MQIQYVIKPNIIPKSLFIKIDVSQDTNIMVGLCYTIINVPLTCGQR